MVDTLPLVTGAAAVVSVVWGTFAIRDILKKNRLSSEELRRESDQRLLDAMDNRLGVIKTQAEKDRELFLQDKNEKDKLILTLKDDIHMLEKHLEELCRSVSKHDGILEQQTPTIKHVTDAINDLKIQVGILEKGLH